MEREQLRPILEKEQARCLAKLAELDPGTEAYSNCLYSLQHVSGWLHDLDFSPCDDATPAPAKPAVPAPAEPADSEPAPTSVEPQMKKEDVRASLAEARMKGVDVSKLISDLGAANLSSVDPADYPKLMDALAKELEGK